MLVQIPSGSIMSDERYFPDPAQFIPERFSPEAKAEKLLDRVPGIASA